MVGDPPRLQELFDPRSHRWDDHFGWDGVRIVPKTLIGEVTIRVLCLNSEERLQVCNAWQT